MGNGLACRAFTGVLLFLAFVKVNRAHDLASSWGIDAVLSRHVDADESIKYSDLLKSSDVQIIRERGTADAGVLDRFNALTANGLRLLGFAQDAGLVALNEWGVFEADLRRVFRHSGEMQIQFSQALSVWELHNEPELAWWPDMPDRYASHAKAVYPGIKSEVPDLSNEAPVLLGSLGLPAGPWLERVARNGVLYYGDAWNVHYYGEATQFSGFIDGHVAAMRDLIELDLVEPELNKLYFPHWPLKEAALSAPRRFSAASGGSWPIWVTEIGINTVTPATWADAYRRKRQADFIISTARQALARPEVAVFMPFILVHKGDGYSMTESATQTWPAWDAYAKLTRENPWPSRPTLRATAIAPNPVVLQWLADAGTASGHKLSAAYRWRADGRPIRGELRIYNFGTQVVSGKLGASKGGEPFGSRLSSAPSPFKARVTVPPGGMVSLPLSFHLDDAPGQGMREWRQFTFRDEKGRRSELGFSLERSPDLYPPEWSGLALGDWSSAPAGPFWKYLPHAVASDSRGPWSAVNGVKVLYAKGGLARFEVGAEPSDPEYPPYAAASIPRGLPPTGWLRVAARPSGPVWVRFRVDLIDQAGRRFTQWENLGHVRGLPATAPRWLNLADFHPYAWGKLDARRRLVPSEVREVQLRFYAKRGPAMIDVELGYGAEYGDVLDPAGEVVMRRTGDTSISAPVE